MTAPLPPLPDEVEKAMERVRCHDCEGSGELGFDQRSGRRISCETCGGHEDALGTGLILDALRLAIRRALLEEREACAAIGDEWSHKFIKLATMLYDKSPQHFEKSGQACAAGLVAQEIRARPVSHE